MKRNRKTPFEPKRCIFCAQNSNCNLLLNVPKYYNLSEGDIMKIFQHTKVRQLREKIERSNRKDLHQKIEKIVKEILEAKDEKEVMNFLGIKGLGFKKYSGLKKSVWGIDLAGAERLIITFANTDKENENDRAFFAKYLKPDENAIVFRDIAMVHDEQDVNAKLATKQKTDDLELLKKLEGIADDINPEKDKYEEILGNGKYKAVLTENKHDIIKSFIDLEKRTAISVFGVAGSGKTVLMMELIEKIKKEYPDNKILYVTYSNNLKNYVYENVILDNRKNVYIKTLKDLIIDSDDELRKLDEEYKKYNDKLKQGEQPKEIPFEGVDRLEEFIKHYKTLIGIDYGMQKKIINITKAYESYYIYSEIYGIISGFMLDGWSRTGRDSLITLDEYKSITSDYKIFKEDELETVYELARLFFEWMDNKSIVTYNGRCMKNLSKSNEKYDFVLIDEVQDLTEVQINYIFSFLKEKKNLVIAGDSNQIINPTFFKEGSMEKLFNRFKLYHKTHRLSGNFRNSSQVTTFINQLNDIRNKNLRSRKLRDSQDEVNNNTVVGHIYKYNGKIDDLREVIGSNIQFLSNNENGNYKGDLTIKQSKGCEYDNVVLIDVLSDCKEKFEELGKNKDALLEYCFNLFYVGSTRSKNVLVLCESKETKVLDLLIKREDSVIEEISCVDDIDWNIDSSANGFFEKARSLFDQGHYQQAEDCLKRAKEMDTEKSIDENEYDILYKKIYVYKTFDYPSQRAREFESIEYYEEAAKNYRDCREYSKELIMGLFIAKENKEDMFKAFSRFVEECKEKEIELSSYTGDNRYSKLIAEGYQSLNDQTKDKMIWLELITEEFKKKTNGEE